MKPCPPVSALQAVPQTLPHGDPMFLWGSLAMKTMQMSTAALQVIALRGARMAAAGLHPSADDRREMELMGEEKVDAFARAGTALVAGVTPVIADLTGSAFRTGMELFAATARLATSRSLPQTLRRHRRLADALMQQAPAAQGDASAAAARLAHSALDPVYATTTANARRLSHRARTA